MLATKVWTVIELTIGKKENKRIMQTGLTIMDIMVDITVMEDGAGIITDMDQEIERMKRKTIGMMQAMTRKKKAITQPERK